LLIVLVCTAASSCPVPFASTVHRGGLRTKLSTTCTAPVLQCLTHSPGGADLA
jgi:hypothetical protein